MTDAVVTSSWRERTVPLVVDVDGTLIRTDLLIESAFAHVGADVRRSVRLVASLRRGKAALKASIAAETDIDVAGLPYNADVLALIAEAREQGRTVVLASASHERYVAAIAAHLGLDSWHASDDDNLSGEAKARRLVEVFGAKGFDYVGNGRSDLPVWAVAQRCVAVAPSPTVAAALSRLTNDAAQTIGPPGGRLRAWIKLLRVHQWTKNALVFVPVLTAHRLNLEYGFRDIGAFVAFSLTASAVYILNDLVDIDADRKHPTKRRRPLAAGTVPILAALPVMVGLLVAAALLAGLVGMNFAAVLLGYFGVTTAYTFSLKRKMLVDVVTLASLYTLRVIGGAAAVDVPISEWLLAFSMFMFMALALIKRYTELVVRLDQALSDPTNRDYRKADLPVISAVAAAAGFNAVTVFALYVSSDTVHQLYHRPGLLWLVCPVLMYWISRALLLAHRREMHDDPIFFAFKDRTSILCFILVMIIVICAT